MRRNTKLLVGFTCLHLVMAVAATVYALAAGSAQFDRPDLRRMFGAGIAEAMASTLTLPGRLLWTSWASQNLSNAFEWALLIANSALWGAGAVALTSKMSRRPEGPAVVRRR